MKANPKKAAPAKSRCRICHSPDPALLLDFGPQPICNRYLASPTDPEALFPLTLMQCRQCGQIQLKDMAPALELRPRVDWIAYEEAEGHLDSLVEDAVKITGLPSDGLIYGLSYKDRSTLGRFEQRGFSRTVAIDLAKDLGEAFPGAGVEMVQDRLTPERAETISGKYGKAHLVIGRHILEHAQDIHRFMDGVSALLVPGGYFIVEVPDFSFVLEHFDYSTIWEEHSVFFTPLTLPAALPQTGFDVVKTINYPYPLENALVVIGKKAGKRESVAINKGAVDSEVKKGRNYAAAFPEIRENVKTYLSIYRERKGAVAMFGAGHLACKFINLMGIKDNLALIADDHPMKNGMFAPGSKLPIFGSSALYEHVIRLCLLSLKPKGEEIVIHKNRALEEHGGQFATIFPTGPRSLDRLIKENTP